LEFEMINLLLCIIQRPKDTQQWEVLLVIACEKLTRQYGPLTAVNRVSFEINQGEIVGLLGHNGAGKTTIMKMMTGYLEPTEGRVLVDGKDMADHRREAQSKIGYLP
jgi:ABC-2 type transport system ATP-binding protein